MTNRLLLTFFVFAVAGCASTNPQTNVSQANNPQANNPQANSAAASAAADSNRTTEPLMESGAAENKTVANESTSGSRSSIEDIESPTVEQTQLSNSAVTANPEPAIKCERVYPTGSIIPVRVCRDQAAAARKTDQDQRIFDHVKRSSAIGGANAATCAGRGPNC